MKSVFERPRFWKHGVLSGMAFYPGDVLMRFDGISTHNSFFVVFKYHNAERIKNKFHFV